MGRPKRAVAAGALIVSVAFVAAVCRCEKAMGQQTYPRVNLSASYEVDPHWPQTPSGFEPAAVSGVHVDAQDRVWVFTRTTPPVQLYDADGTFLRGWGNEDVKTAHHIELDQDGNVWLADIGLHVVRKFTPEGKLLLTLGTPGEPGEDETHLNQPTDMAITPSGDIFVSDGYGNNRVVHFDSSGAFVAAWGRLGTGPGEFSLPHAIAADSKGRLYVADRNNARVQVFDGQGRFLNEWRSVVVPWGLWVNRSDEIWVCGSSPMTWPEEGEFGVPPKDQVFMKFNSEGKLLTLWTVPKGRDGDEKPGECNWVHAIAEDSQGNLYVGDILGKRIQKFLRRR